MMTQTLAQMRQRVRDECDLGSDPNGFITDTMLNTWLNSDISYLYGKLATAFGEQYYLKVAVVTGVVNQSVYDLPDDCWKTIGLDVALDNSGSNWGLLQPYQIKQRTLFTQGFIPIAIVAPYYMRYQLQGTQVRFIPDKTAPGPVQFRIWYVPVPPTLVADGDTFDGIAGWEELVIIYTCLRAKARLEEDASQFMARKADWDQRIMDEKRSRDAAEPLRKLDTRGMGYSTWPISSFGGGVL